MKNIFETISGIAPVVLVVIFIAYLMFEKNTKDMDVKEVKMERSVNKFDAEFSDFSMRLSDTVEEKQFHRTEKEKSIQKNVDMDIKQKEAEEKKKVMDKKSEDTFSDLEDVMKNFDKKSEKESGTESKKETVKSVKPKENLTKEEKVDDLDYSEKDMDFSMDDMNFSEKDLDF